MISLKLYFWNDQFLIFDAKLTSLELIKSKIDLNYY